MNMGGLGTGMGMGWDPQGGMAPHLAALGGYSFPGQGGMIPPFGMAMGMMPGMMPMEGQGQGQGFIMEEDMRGEGYQDHQRYRADDFYGGRGDNRGFEQSARDSRYEAPVHDRHGAQKSHQDDDRRRGDREKSGRDRERDRDRDDNKSSSTSDRRESNDDDRDKSKKRRRDGDDESSRTERERDRGRESDRSFKGERDVDRRRR